MSRHRRRYGEPLLAGPPPVVMHRGEQCLIVTRRNPPRSRDSRATLSHG